MAKKSPKNGRAKNDIIIERLDKLEAGQAEVKADVEVLKSDVAELKTDVAELKTGQARLEKRMDGQNEILMKLYEIVENEQKKNTAFREQMLRIADNTTKKYDDFQIEKIATGANIDRLQDNVDGLNRSVDGLQASDHKQNATISNHESRLLKLESRQKSS